MICGAAIALLRFCRYFPDNICFRRFSFAEHVILFRNTRAEADRM
jgi:hypothetical protein